MVHHNGQRGTAERERIDSGLRLCRHQPVDGRESAPRGMARTGVDDDDPDPDRLGQCRDWHRIVPPPEDREPWWRFDDFKADCQAPRATFKCPGRGRSRREDTPGVFRQRLHLRGVFEAQRQRDFARAP